MLRHLTGIRRTFVAEFHDGLSLLSGALCHVFIRTSLIPKRFLPLFPLSVNYLVVVLSPRTAIRGALSDFNANTNGLYFELESSDVGAQ